MAVTRKNSAQLSTSKSGNASTSKPQGTEPQPSGKGSRKRSLDSDQSGEPKSKNAKTREQVAAAPRDYCAKYKARIVSLRAELAAHAPVVCDQVGGWACGLHAVLSGWCLALGLTFRPTATLDEQFYRDAITMINSAVYGLVEAQLISDFLKCTGYVTPDGSPASRKFNNTVELENTTALNNLVAQIVDDDLLTAVMAQSEQGN
ncbi:hypothetical protein B0A48_05708 [Cryoendolithus antarcticus]|uniref:Uncharacterized protein n=1 Tax=Cryoendolithus antarcticus TaxID=1507870 RepID=A0A1V8TC40_9PEZI|nr:hypothetical protein B0A48_05708 [Cryoendolithus antarcticus]